MMISSGMYIGMHKDDTFEQLIAEKDLLVSEIKELENIVFDSEKKSEEWNVRPGPDVRYQIYLEYLAELCNFLKEKYSNEIVWNMDDEE